LKIFIIFKMRHGFGINTDLFETNVLNLAVVVGIVVTVVGEAVSNLLEQRRKTILSTLEETDKKVREAQTQLDDAKKSVEIARLQAKEIRIQATKAVEQENVILQRQLKESLQYLQERGKQAIQLERQRIIQTIANQVAELALTSTEGTLLTAFEKTYSKQRELNETHIRKTFRQLKR